MIDEGSLTVGALAKASGLTVRTLHHWDALGLLVPAGRSASGYRRLRPGRGRAAVPDRLVRILDVLDADAEPSLDQLIDTIEVMTLHERYYTPEQLQQLSERADALGEEGMRKAEQGACTKPRGRRRPRAARSRRSSWPTRARRSGCARPPADAARRGPVRSAPADAPLARPRPLGAG